MSGNGNLRQWNFHKEKPIPPMRQAISCTKQQKGGKMQKILTLTQFLNIYTEKKNEKRRYDATHQELSQNQYLPQLINLTGSAGITC